MASFRSYDNSNVIATLIMTNFHLSLRVRSFGMVRIRISDPRSLGSWKMKWADESLSRVDSTVVAIFPNVWVYGDVVYAQWSRELLILKNCIESSSYASTTYVVASYGPRFFSNFLEKFGHLREFFGQMVYRPRWQKIARTPMLENILAHGHLWRGITQIEYSSQKMAQQVWK